VTKLMDYGNLLPFHVNLTGFAFDSEFIEIMTQNKSYGPRFLV